MPKLMNLVTPRLLDFKPRFQQLRQLSTILSAYSIPNCIIKWATEGNFVSRRLLCVNKLYVWQDINPADVVVVIAAAAAGAGATTAGRDRNSKNFSPRSCE